MQLPIQRCSQLGNISHPGCETVRPKYKNAYFPSSVVHMHEKPLVPSTKVQISNQEPFTIVIKFISRCEIIILKNINNTDFQPEPFTLVEARQTIFNIYLPLIVVIG